ncbi:sensor histidine kinase [Paraburkholderia mimosarum]|uniref:sensor histidine kinase n=1 Tax=Paraburkholderia mimosarum TaxID=312026 RepID=UPI00041D0248|nr:HAMP domain-containing sensor histidine kinase [Paraburkholderia mimosarum]
MRINRTSTGRPHQHWRRTLFFTMSIRLAVVGVVFMLIQLLAVIWMYVRNPNELDQLLISAEANRIAQEISTVRPDAGIAFSDALRQPLAPRTRRSFLIHEKGGSIVGRYDDGDLRIEQEAPVSFLVIRTQRETWGDRFLLTGTRRVSVGDRPFWITVAISGEGFAPFIPVIYDEIRFHVVIPLILLSALLLLFNFSVVKSTLKPLNEAIAAVNNIDPSQITNRIEAPTPSWEVQALVRAVNRMLDRLQRSVETTREFAGNAAHELRTPLSILMLGIGNLPNSDAKAKLAKDAHRMKRLVDQMLDMAQASTIEINADAKADLNSIARDVSTELLPLAVARGRSIAYVEAGGATIRGHAEAIGRALRNVIENGLEHTPEGSTVEVTSGPGRCCSVRDYGRGIPEAERARIFDRFYRIDRTRSGGAGLGLAIATAIMEAHGGRIDVADAPGGGTLVSLRF